MTNNVKTFEKQNKIKRTCEIKYTGNLVPIWLILKIKVQCLEARVQVCLVKMMVVCLEKNRNKRYSKSSFFSFE